MNHAGPDTVIYVVDRDPSHELGARAPRTASGRQSDGELLLNRSSSLLKRTDCDS